MNVLLKAAETAAGCKAVHVVIAEEVAGLVGVDDEQSGPPFGMYNEEAVESADFLAAF